VGVVAYGPVVLCPSCDKMRSAVGRTEVGRKLPASELGQVIEAALELSRAEERLGLAVRVARGAGASWSQVGDALGVTRQAAQQRLGSEGDTARVVAGEGSGR
jgi:hypothetical protein